MVPGFKSQNRSPFNKSANYNPFPVNLKKGKLTEDNHGRPKTIAGVNSQQSQILEDAVLGDAARRYGTKRVKGMS